MEFLGRKEFIIFDVERRFFFFFFEEQENIWVILVFIW